jgi:hypothetical protein
MTVKKMSAMDRFESKQDLQRSLNQLLATRGQRHFPQYQCLDGLLDP